MDTVGENYDEERSIDGGPLLFPCLGWGCRKRVTYSIRLSRSISASVSFDVVVVPTSWWPDDIEGTYCVIQIWDSNERISNELNLESYGYRQVYGYNVVLLDGGMSRRIF